MRSRSSRSDLPAHGHNPRPMGMHSVHCRVWMTYFPLQQPSSTFVVVASIWAKSPIHPLFILCPHRCLLTTKGTIVHRCIMPFGMPCLRAIDRAVNFFWEIKTNFLQKAARKLESVDQGPDSWCGFSFTSRAGLRCKSQNHSPDFGEERHISCERSLIYFCAAALHYYST